MNMELCKALEEVIEQYNEHAGEYEQLYWWDVLNNIVDITDDEEVINVIIGIEKAAEALMQKHAAGY